jgi:trehalose-6-phosphate synthase
MPAEERRRRHANLLEPLRELTAANYCKAFLRELSVPVAQHSLLMSAE